jgi:hypothetical protein
MTPKDRIKTWCGHTASWHYEQVGPEHRSYSRYYKQTTPNMQEAYSGSKGSTTPAAQAQLKKHTRTHPGRSAQHACA